MLKKLLVASVLFSSFSAFAEKNAKVEKIEIDPAASKLVYLGKKVTGEHTGEVKLANGFLNFDGENLKSGEFTIDMTTITNTDISDKDYHKKFIDHIISEDFFAVDKYKTATLAIKSAKKVKDNTYKLSGDLTIKGKKAPISFDADVTKTAGTAVVKFDRTVYDIKYGSGKFFQGLGDKMINDEVQLTVNLAAKK